MNVRKKLNKYVQEMEIPEGKKVLPPGTEVEKEGRSRKNYMRWAIGAGAVCCAFLIAFVCIKVIPNVLKKSSRDYGVAGIDGVIEKYSSSSRTGTDGYTAMDAELSGDPDVYDDSGVTEYEENIMTAAAGTLTGGEIRDLKNWDNWLRTLDENIMSAWNLFAKNRITVYVHDGSTALNNVSVKLMSGEQCCYSAVTDISGHAYLFYNIKSGEDIVPDVLQVETSDGNYENYELADCLNSESLAEIELQSENPELKMDLMLVTDTTGSMGDELEFLQAELEDVILRVEEETGIDIRTSVNFYRDEGDEYVVKYYDFRENEAEVTDILREQSANGGGDYEEAVEVALDNAINGHAWADDGSIKLMFLVLDAPPHNTEEISEMLYELMVEASGEGIRIIPVAASGADDATQQLLRSFAILTGGTFVFLDDNSGVGYSHEIPVDSSEYDSEYLNSMLIRIIGEYCGVEISADKVETETNPQQGN